MVRRLAHAEVGDERAEAVAPEPGHQAAGELQGVEHLVRELDPAPRGRDEGAVELDVVPDQDAPLDELLEARHHLGDGWRVRDHAVRYAGQAHDEGVYRPSRVDERRELVDHLPAHELEGAELRDGAPLAGRGARGLDVEDHVGGLVDLERAGVGGPQTLALPGEPGVAFDQPLHQGAGVAVGAREREESCSYLLRAHRLVVSYEAVETRRHEPPSAPRRAEPERAPFSPTRRWSWPASP